LVSFAKAASNLIPAFQSAGRFFTVPGYIFRAALKYFAVLGHSALFGISISEAIPEFTGSI
jgi:hypothetical protein